MALTLRFGGAIPPAFSDGIETVPRQYAVCYRNRWMIRRSDYVITHVSSPVGSGEAKFKDLAEKQGKTVNRAADYNEYRYWCRELRCLYLCLIPFVTEQIFANGTFTFTVNAAAGTAITLAPKWGTNSHDATLHNDDFITATGSQQSNIQAPDNSVTAKPSAEPTAPTTPTTPTTPSSTPAESATTAPEPSATAPTEPEP